MPQRFSTRAEVEPCCAISADDRPASMMARRLRRPHQHPAFPRRFGIGVGTLVMWLNVIFLGGYTFSCHSCRHVCGGSVNQFSKAPTRYALWKLVTRLNERHPTFAWLSLFSVGLTDLYIRLVSMGVIRDLRIVF